MEDRNNPNDNFVQDLCLNLDEFVGKLSNYDPENLSYMQDMFPVDVNRNTPSLNHSDLTEHFFYNNDGANNFYGVSASSDVPTNALSSQNMNDIILTNTQPPKENLKTSKSKKNRFSNFKEKVRRNFSNTS